MSHWQLFIVGSTFAYFIIAAGLYAWVTTKTEPYLGVLPSEITPTFMKLVFLITSFGWPLVLQVYIYFTIVDKLSDLAGVKWKELVAFDHVRMQLSNKDKLVADADEIAENIAGKKLAERVNLIAIGLEVDGQARQAIFRNKETIADLLGETMNVGSFLRTFVRADSGKIDAEFEESGDSPVDRAPAIHVPSDEEINDMIVSAPVAPMTRAPNPEEIVSLDNQALMKLVYAIANDRAVACQALGAIENLATDYAENGPSYEQLESKDAATRVALEKSCAHARAVVNAWMDLVK